MTIETVGYGALQVIPSMRGFSAQMDRELAKVMPAAGIRAGEKMGQGASDGFGRSISGITRHAKYAAIGVTAALGAGAIAIGKWGLDIAANNEQAQISFETMLGSAEKASAFLDQLRDFAAKTPFEFPELQTAASSLISAGIEASKVIPIMTTLGDVTAGMGTGSEGIKRATIALQQMTAAGKINGEDLNQLRDAGIPVYDLLAAATGRAKSEVVALAQAGKLGKADLDALMAGLESGKGLERFSGLMDKQSKSLTGLISSLKDNLGQGLATALEPAVVQLKDIIPGATEVATNGMVLLGDGIEQAIAAGRDFAGWAGPLASDLGDHAVPVLEDLAEITGDVLPVALGATQGAIEGTVTVLNPLIDTVKIGTGFLSDHEGAVLGVAAAYAAFKLAPPGIKGASVAWDVVTSSLHSASAAGQQFMADMQFAAVTNNLTKPAAAAQTLRGSISSLASTSVSGGAIAGGAIAGLATGATLAFESLQRSADHGRESAEKFIDAMNVDPANTRSLYTGLVATNAQIQELQKETGRSNWTQFRQRLNPFDKNTIDEAAAEQERLAEVFDDYQRDLGKLQGAAQLLGASTDEVDAWRKKLDINLDDIGPKRLAWAIGEARNAAAAGSPETDRLAAAYKLMGDETSTSTEKLKGWKDALDAALGIKVNLFDATTNYAEGLASFEETLKAGVWGGFGTDTEAGRASRQALSEQIGNIQELANAYADMGDLEKANEAIRTGRNEIIEAGVAAGVSREQMIEYVDALGLTEGTWKAQIELKGADEAKLKADALQASLNLLAGTRSMPQIKLDIAAIAAATDQGTTTTVGPVVIPGTKPKRWGGIDHYLGGGIRDQSMIGNGNNLVWWDEPATGGEGYFPRNDRNRAQTDANMRTVAAWYGGQYLSSGEKAKQVGPGGSRRTRFARTGRDVTVIAAGASAKDVSDTLMWETR